MRGKAFILLVAVVACSQPPTKLPERPRSTGYPQAQHVLPLLVLRNPMLSETAELIGRAGEEDEKKQAAQRLISLSDAVASDAWRQAQATTVARVHRQRNSTTGDRKAQLLAWQGRHLIKVYDAMGMLGGVEVLAHCKAVANNAETSSARRQAATSVLAKHGKTKRKAEVQGYRMPIVGAAALAPQRMAPVDLPSVQGAAVIDVQQVVKELRPKFLRCYNWVVQAIGPFSAWVILNARVGADGRVTGANSRGDISSPPQLATCLVGVVRQARFAPLVGGAAAVVSIPLTLSPPRRPAAARTKR